jgi:hypothetical protein
MAIDRLNRSLKLLILGILTTGIGILQATADIAAIRTDGPTDTSIRIPTPTLAVDTTIPRSDQRVKVLLDVNLVVNLTESLSQIKSTAEPDSKTPANATLSTNTTDSSPHATDDPRDEETTANILDIFFQGDMQSYKKFLGQRFSEIDKDRVRI